MEEDIKSLKAPALTFWSISININNLLKKTS